MYSTRTEYTRYADATDENQSLFVHDLSIAGVWINYFLSLKGVSRFPFHNIYFNSYTIHVQRNIILVFLFLDSN